VGILESFFPINRFDLTVMLWFDSQGVKDDEHQIVGPEGIGYRREPITGSTRTSVRMSASVAKADLVRVPRHVAKVPILLQKFVEAYDER
jgi:hypothetical protein